MLYVLGLYVTCDVLYAEIPIGWEIKVGQVLHVHTILGGMSGFVCRPPGRTWAATAMKKMQNICKVFFAANAVDNMFGRAAHPFHVRSWKQRGDKNKLEETLAPLARLVDKPAVDLVKDYLSSFDYVYRLVERGIGLREAWVQTAGVFKKNWSATMKECLYVVLGMMDGTGTLESRFQVVQMCAQYQKGGQTDASVRARMRIKINGPSLEEFCAKSVHGGNTVYTPGLLCLQAQHHYALLFGTKCFSKKRKLEKLGVVKEGEIAKRRDIGISRKKRHGFRPAFLAAQQAQRTAGRASGSQGDADLAQAIEEISGQMSEGQEAIIKKLHDARARKQELQAEIALPQGGNTKLKKKWEDHTKANKQFLKKVKMVPFSMESQKALGRSLDLKEVAFHAPEESSRDLLRRFAGIQTSNIFKKQHVVPMIRAAAKHQIWVVRSSSDVAECLQDFAMKDEELTAEIIAIRMFGGYLVDECWLKEAYKHFQATGKFLEPHLKVAPAVADSKEVLLHNKWDKPESIASILLQADPARLDLTGMGPESPIVPNPLPFIPCIRYLFDMRY